MCTFILGKFYLDLELSRTPELVWTPLTVLIISYADSCLRFLDLSLLEGSCLLVY